MYLKNVHVVNCQTGLSVPAGSNAVLDGVVFDQCVKAIEERDPPHLLGALGLRADTPVEKIAPLLKALSNGQIGKDADLAAKAEGAGLKRWLAAGADLATLAQALHALRSSGLIDKVLGALIG